MIRKKLLPFLIMFTGILLLNTQLLAEPAILNSSGSLNQGGTVAISGSDFGEGPNVILFDDFENGTSGNDVLLTSPSIGEWTSYGAFHPTVADTAHSGGKSMEIYEATGTIENQCPKQVQKELGSVTEAYISYWVRIPDGTFFPSATEAGVLSSVSSWNFYTLLDYSNGSGSDDDLNLPTYAGRFHVVGNDGYLYTGFPKNWETQVNIPQDWWTFDGWMRISTWLKGVNVDQADAYDSKIRFEFLNEGVLQSVVEDESGVNIFDGADGTGDNTISQWTQINFPGWMRSGTDSLPVANSRPVYDDIYIATGNNAQARIEIGNNAVYTNCTNLQVQSPASWNSDSIQFTFNMGSFSSGDTAFLFVIDKDGNVSDGYPVVIGGASSGELVINNVDGLFTNDNQITIGGSDFGEGPNVILFDDFEDGTSGNDVLLTSPSIGEWTNYGTFHPTVADTAHSGGKSMEIYEATGTIENQRPKQVQKELGSVTEAYVSYWVRIPDGTFFPSATETGVLSSVSSWNFYTLLDYSNASGSDDDLNVPTYAGRFHVVGNDGYLYTGSPKNWETQVDIPQDWWTFDGWMRISAWLKGVNVDQADAYDSKIRFEFLNEGVLQSVVEDESGVNIFDGADGTGDNTISQWTQINFPGWMRSGTVSQPVANSRPVYDDIYIATGNNAQARIEIGNNAVYANCTNLQVQSPVSWNSSVIQFSFNMGSFSSGDTAFLFVIDKDGNVSDGYPIVIASSTQPVNAPGNLIATAVTSNSITLSWSDNSDNETAFIIERKTTGSYTEIVTLSADTIIYSDGALTPETEYTYRIKAVNNEGSSDWSETVSVFTSSGSGSGTDVDFISMGPGGGGQMYGFGISPHNSSIMHVSCDMGTFYVSEDEGSSWKMINQLQMIGIRSTRPLYHPTNPNVVIMPYYRKYKQLRISYDKGYTWEILYGKVTSDNFTAKMTATGKYYYQFSDDEVDEIVTKLSLRGILNDKGRVKIEWLKSLSTEFRNDFSFSEDQFDDIINILVDIHQVPWGFPYITDDYRKLYEGVTAMSTDPLNADVIFISTLKGLYRSDDGGESFVISSIIDQTHQARGVYISPDATVEPRYIAADSNAVYTSNDGIAWSKSGSGLPVNNLHQIYGFTAATYQSTSGKMIYSYISHKGGVYYSSDSGSTFTKNASPDPTSDDLIHDNDNSSLLHFMFVSMSETDHQVAYVSNYGSNWQTFGVFKTIDGGVTWSNVYDAFGLRNSGGEINSGYVGNSYHILDRSWGGQANCITVAPNNPNIVAYVNAMECLLTVDGGATWNEKASTYYDTAGGYKSDHTFAGKGLEVALPTNMVWDPFNNDRVYLIYGDLQSFVSTDRGATWRRKVSGIPTSWGNRMWEIIPDPEKTDVLYSVASNNHGSVQVMSSYSGGRLRGGVLTSHDAGESWKSIVGGEITASDFAEEGFLKLAASEYSVFSFLAYKIGYMTTSSEDPYLISFLVDNDMNDNGPPVEDKDKREYHTYRTFTGFDNDEINELENLAILNDISEGNRATGIENVLIKSRDDNRLPFDTYPCTGLALDPGSPSDPNDQILYALYPVEGLYKGSEISGEWKWERMPVKGLGTYMSQYDTDGIEGTGDGMGSTENKIFEQVRIGPDGSLYVLTIGRRNSNWQWSYPDGGIWRLDKNDFNNPNAEWVEITSGITTGLTDPRFYTIDMKSTDSVHPRIFLSSSFESGSESEVGLWEGVYNNAEQKWTWNLVVGYADLNDEQYLYGWVQAGEVSIHPNKPYVYYSTKTHGLWISEEDGAKGTWRRIKGIPRLATGKVVVDPDSDDIIYVNSVGLWKGPATGLTLEE